MSLFDLSHRVALITGAGQGMGLDIARSLAVQGARFVQNDYFEERDVAVSLTNYEGATG